MFFHLPKISLQCRCPYVLITGICHSLGCYNQMGSLLVHRESRKYCTYQIHINLSAYYPPRKLMVGWEIINLDRSRMKWDVERGLFGLEMEHDEEQWVEAECIHVRSENQSQHALFGCGNIGLFVKTITKKLSQWRDVGAKMRMSHSCKRCGAIWYR